jgi:hypothetical protein
MRTGTRSEEHRERSLPGGDRPGRTNLSRLRPRRPLPRAVIDDEFEEVTEQEEDSRRERLKSKWAALEAIVGDEKRVQLIAEDVVRHFERRLEAMDGKAMVVCMLTAENFRRDLTVETRNQRNKVTATPVGALERRSWQNA